MKRSTSIQPMSTRFFKNGTTMILTSHRMTCFYDWDPSEFSSDEDQHIHSSVRECCTIFDVSFVTAPSGPRPARTNTACGVIHNSGKPLLHIPIHVGNRKIWALVDTGAAASFIQFSLAKKLGIWENHVRTREQVRYANGVTEPVLGIVPLNYTLQSQQMST